MPLKRPLSPCLGQPDGPGRGTRQGPSPPLTAVAFGDRRPRMRAGHILIYRPTTFRGIPIRIRHVAHEIA